MEQVIEKVEGMGAVLSQKGITFKMIDNRLMVARILYEGLIHRQGNCFCQYCDVACEGQQ